MLTGHTNDTGTKLRTGNDKLAGNGRDGYYTTAKETELCWTREGKGQEHHGQGTAPQKVGFFPIAARERRTDSVYV